MKSMLCYWSRDASLLHDRRESTKGEQLLRNQREDYESSNHSRNTNSSFSITFTYKFLSVWGDVRHFSTMANRWSSRCSTVTDIGSSKRRSSAFVVGTAWATLSSGSNGRMYWTLSSSLCETTLSWPTRVLLHLSNSITKGRWFSPQAGRSGPIRR